MPITMPARRFLPPIVMLLLLVMSATPLRAQQRGRVFPRVYTGHGVKLRDVSAQDKLYPVSVRNQYGLMNQQGALVVFPRFEWADFSYEGWTRIVRNGKTGFLSNNYNWLVEPRLAYADRVANGMVIVGDGEHYGFINKAAKLVVPMRLDGALRFRENFAAVQLKGRCGFINRKGDLAIPLRYQRVRSFHQGLAMVQLPSQRPGRPGVMGYIRKDGRWAFRDDGRRFQDLGDFNQGLARAESGGKWGYINRAFKWQIEPRFDGARDFTDGLAAVKVGERWGYIDKRGELVVAPRYTFADDFDDTLALVRMGDRFGYVDRRGRVAIAPQFKRAEPFFRDYAKVSHPPSFGYIGLSGNVIWDPRAPLESITDLRLREKARLSTEPELSPGNRRLRLPRAREPKPRPYAPDFVYEEQLPDPIQLRWRELDPDARAP